MPEVIRDNEGKPFSKWKPAERFRFMLEKCELPGVIEEMRPEFPFNPDRKWRFDYAWPSQNLAVEIDGFGWGHQAQQNISAANEKRNSAVEAGWRVLVFDSRLLGSKAKVEEAVEQVCRVLCSVQQSGECRECEGG